ELRLLGSGPVSAFEIRRWLPDFVTRLACAGCPCPEVIDPVPELVGRDLFRPAPGGRLANATVGGDDGQGLGIGILADHSLYPRIRVFIVECEDELESAISGFEREVARRDRGIKD